MIHEKKNGDVIGGNVNVEKNGFIVRLHIAQIVVRKSSE